MKYEERTIVQIRHKIIMNHLKRFKQIQELVTIIFCFYYRAKQKNSDIRSVVFRVFQPIKFNKISCSMSEI